MATIRLRLAFVVLLIIASLVLATAAGAQFARGPATFDQVRVLERAQFRDFWDDRGWSNRNNSPGSFWGDRRRPTRIDPTIRTPPIGGNRCTNPSSRRRRTRRRCRQQRPWW